MRDNLIDFNYLYSAVRISADFYASGSGVSATVRHGTGFFLAGCSTEGEVHYLVSNRHVLDPAYPDGTSSKLFACERIRISGHYQNMRSAEVPLEPFEEIIQSPTVALSYSSDVAIVKLESAPRGGLLNCLEASILASSHAFSAGEISVGARVLIPGYPTLTDVSRDRPILVSGVVASDPRFEDTIHREGFSSSVLCHAYSGSGMSGAPVMCASPLNSWGELQEGRPRMLLVGVNAGHIASNDVTAGVLSYFVKSTEILTLLRSLGEISINTTI